MDTQDDVAKTKPIEVLLAEIQALIRAHIQPTGVIVDEFIAEKRQEALREDLDHRD